MRWYESANEAAFKPAPGGRVFQAPSPWMLARPRYYLVNEAQKAELLASLGRWRLLLMTALIAHLALALSVVLPIILWPKTFARFVAPMHHQLGTDLFAAAFGVLIVLLMVPILAVPQIYLARALRRGLADAPRTDERIKVAEQLAKIAVSVPGWVLACGLVGGLAAMSLSISQMFDDVREGHVTRSAIGYAPLLIVGVSMIAYFVYLARLRAKSKQAQTA